MLKGLRIGFQPPLPLILSMLSQHDLIFRQHLRSGAASSARKNWRARLLLRMTGGASRPDSLRSTRLTQLLSVASRRVAAGSARRSRGYKHRPTAFASSRFRQAPTLPGALRAAAPQSTSAIPLSHPYASATSSSARTRRPNRPTPSTAATL